MTMLERTPGALVSIQTNQGGGGGAPVAGVVKCQLTEEKCCGGGLTTCISTTLHMYTSCLEPGNLRNIRVYRNDLLALDESEEQGEDHAEYRHAAYR
jgi:hypothetical protein